MVDMISALLPTRPQILHQRFLLLLTQRFVFLLVEDQDQLEQVILLFAVFQKSFEGVIQHPLVPLRSERHSVAGQRIEEDIAESEKLLDCAHPIVVLQAFQQDLEVVFEVVRSEFLHGLHLLDGAVDIV